MKKEFKDSNCYFSSDLYPFLEQACLEGSRIQSKRAISAMASLMSASDKLIFDDLCEVFCAVKTKCSFFLHDVLNAYLLFFFIIFLLGFLPSNSTVANKKNVEYGSIPEFFLEISLISYNWVPC